MKAEINKYYQLNNEKFYFSVTLQRFVKFQDILVVKCGSGFGKEGHFGYLLDTRFPGGIDYVTENEIEFSDEDIVEYNQKDIFFPYIDYNFIGQGHGKIIKGKTSPEIEFAYG